MCCSLKTDLQESGSAALYAHSVAGPIAALHPQFTVTASRGERSDNTLKAGKGGGGGGRGCFHCEAAAPLHRKLQLESVNDSQQMYVLLHLNCKAVICVLADGVYKRKGHSS